MEFTFEVSGETLIARRLERWGDNAVHAEPAFKQIAADMRDMQKRLFVTSGASGGAQWQALAASTIKRKAETGSRTPTKPLQDTGNMRDSLTEEHHRQHVELTGDTFLVFGTSDPKAGYHQRGAGVPKRRPQQFTEAQKQSILKTLQRHIVEEG